MHFLLTSDCWLLTVFLLFLFGTAVGSFLNVWSRRLLRGKSLTGRSHCERCNHTLSANDLIPLLSFVFLRGRCRYCGELLSWQYPLVEAGTGLLFAALSFKFLLPATDYQLLTLIPLLVASSAFIVILVTDILAQTIADQVLLVSVVSASVYRVLVHFAGLGFNARGLVYDFLGAVGVFTFFQIIRLITKRKGMGDGDPPLGFAAGLLVGFPHVLVQLFLTFTVGGVVGLVLLLLGKKGLKDRVAFGPFLVIATFVVIFAGDQLLNWYLQLLGV